MSLLLGVDIGTASSKAVLTTPEGEVVASATRRHKTSMPRSGHVEMDADAVWWGEFVALTRELVGGTDREVAGVCVSGIGPCLLPTDADHRPLRPGILYGIDTRATVEIDELDDHLGRQEILDRCGKHLSSQSIGPKLLWLRRREPEVWSRTRRWFTAQSYVVARLTGAYVLDHHSASQCDPLYDLGAGDWAADWVDEVVGDLPMPRLVMPGDVVGVVTDDACGLPAGTPVCAGTVDAWAESFSCGVRRPGDLMLMYGSTMFFIQVLDGPRTHPALWATHGVEPGVRTMAAGMATSGSLTAWAQELTGGAPFDQLVAEASAVPPGSDGLLVLPYFAGERNPVFDPDARGVVAGLTLRHGRGHLFRAVYEGIAFGTRQILDLFEEAGGPVTRLVAVGGGTRGGLWPQVVSDVTGRSQQVPAVTIGASYGDALLAAIGTGLVPPETDWTRVAATVEPDPHTAARYGELFEAYTALYPATRDVVHRLAAQQRD